MNDTASNGLDEIKDIYQKNANLVKGILQEPSDYKIFLIKMCLVYTITAMEVYLRDAFIYVLFEKRTDLLSKIKLVKTKSNYFEKNIF